MAGHEDGSALAAVLFEVLQKKVGGSGIQRSQWFIKQP